MKSNNKNKINLCEHHNKIQYKNITINIHPYYSPNTQTQHSCFCCNKEIKNEKAVFLTGDNINIPNTYIHTNCFSTWINKTDELCSDIESAYQQYKKLHKVFK